MRRLDALWVSGKHECTHVGFAIYKLGPLDKPSKRSSKLFSTADGALERAADLGDKFGVFRIFERRGEEFAREQIRYVDLPVHVSNVGKVDDRLRRPAN